MIRFQPIPIDKSLHRVVVEISKLIISLRYFLNDKLGAHPTVNSLAGLGVLEFGGVQ